jgi:hypothetical protein
MKLVVVGLGIGRIERVNWAFSKSWMQHAEQKAGECRLLWILSIIEKYWSSSLLVWKENSLPEGSTL